MSFSRSCRDELFAKSDSKFEGLSSLSRIGTQANGKIGSMFNVGKRHETGSAKSGEESFYPCEHLRCDLWEEMQYDVTPDYKFLRAGESDRARFQPTHLSHVTTFTGAQGICSSRSFTSQTPKNIGVYEHFSWWSLEISENEKEREKNKYQEIIEANGWPSDTIHQFFNSPPFQEESRYGNFKFTYDMESLFEMYENSVCGGRRAEFRVLGTFTYKQEVMHAVVVCPSDVAPLFSSCPLVGNDIQAVVSKSDHGWMWRPDSTRNKLKPYCCWDHVSLAFYLPRGNPEFPLPPGFPPVTCCKESRRILFPQCSIKPECEFHQCLEILRETWEASG
ncbi:uncharacterized protein LOC129704121 [Leucoraja erinacea]|uniref:uncharacterized protein LOC129704121 n=1 Tax=Leucoraja erinaceus TaxID=7782 RepID=UPI0024572588|nr:uncharacterized protein LOC129704121 [Leucoraja erinacea]